jgi:mRNA interferase MazF
VKRGDVYLADLNPSKGSEQAGRRPVILFQDDRLIPATLTVMVIPLTSNLRMQKLPTCVLVREGEGGLRQDSVAICHQMRSLDKQGLVEHWGTVPPERLAEVERVVLRTLGVRGQTGR